MSERDNKCEQIINVSLWSQVTVAQIKGRVHVLKCGLKSTKNCILMTFEVKPEKSSEAFFFFVDQFFYRIKNCKKIESPVNLV